MMMEYDLIETTKIAISHFCSNGLFLL